MTELTKTAQVVRKMTNYNLGMNIYGQNMQKKLIFVQNCIKF